MSSILSEAYVRVATMSNAMNGFKITDVWPVDRHIFKDTDFVAAKTLTPEENDREDEREAASKKLIGPLHLIKESYIKLFMKSAQCLAQLLLEEIQAASKSRAINSKPIQK